MAHLANGRQCVKAPTMKVSAEGVRVLFGGTLLVAAVVLTGVARAQQDDEPSEALPSQEERIEAEVMAKIPSLAPIGDPARIEQLWQLARKLSDRRAYCRAAKHLTDIESLSGGPFTENHNLVAQTYYSCAKTRLTQGFTAEAADKLQRSIALVGERPRHRDLLFKLAIIRTKESVNRGDIAAVGRNMAEARRLGVDAGPGAGDRLADWALPIMHETSTIIATWGKELVDAGNFSLAKEAAEIAVLYHANDRIAESVLRAVFMQQTMLPIGAAATLAVVLLVIVWRVRRWYKFRKVTAEAYLDDDDY